MLILRSSKKLDPPLNISYKNFCIKKDQDPTLMNINLIIMVS